MTGPVEVKQPQCPIILAMPHSGTWLPRELFHKLNETGRKLADTDWHIPQLYDGLLPEAGIVKANFHRYVIDVNRAPDDAELYPGQNTTSLCPTTDFNGQPIWQAGMEPTHDDIKMRIMAYHTLYHTILSQMLQAAKEQYGYAVLYDCHSIRSRVPFLFEGDLPALNIGTSGGVTCGSAVEKTVVGVCVTSGYSYALNGRFKGGWTTRHYGKPEENIHAIQMEIAQATYMQEQEPWSYLPERAAMLRKPLKALLLQLKHIIW